MTHILTVDNYAYSMNNLPDVIDDIRYGVIDYTDPRNVDYIFIPLIFLESFNKSAIDLKIGPHRILMPSDWSILISDKHSGEVEVLSLKQINDRDFTAFVFNQIGGYFPEFYDISVENIFPDMKWFFPKLKYGHILSVPLAGGKNPPCAFFIKDANKIPESLDITQLV